MAHSKQSSNLLEPERSDESRIVEAEVAMLIFCATPSTFINLLCLCGTVCRRLWNESNAQIWSGNIYVILITPYFQLNKITYSQRKQNDREKSKETYLDKLKILQAIKIKTSPSDSIFIRLK